MAVKSWATSLALAALGSLLLPDAGVCDVKVLPDARSTPTFPEPPDAVTVVASPAPKALDATTAAGEAAGAPADAVQAIVSPAPDALPARTAIGDAADVPALAEPSILQRMLTWMVEIFNPLAARR
jgi:hypothetical protein